MIVTSVLSLLTLGFVAACVLALASRVFYVDEDPRVEAVLNVLPGANCGGCGFAGCEAYAQAVLSDPSVSPGLCCAGGPEITEAVGELSGKAPGDAEPLVSFRRCVKDEGHVKTRYEYQGFRACAAAAMLEYGPDMCRYSCLGFGECARGCPFDAMYIEDGLVHIEEEKCTSCGICVRICPRHLLELIPRRARVMVYCATKDKMRDVVKVCEAGCITCGKCVKKCPAGAITQEDARVMIDQKACLAYGPDCGEACVQACPRHILRRTCPVAVEKLPEINAPGAGQDATSA